MKPCHRPRIGLCSRYFAPANGHGGGQAATPSGGAVVRYPSFRWLAGPLAMVMAASSFALPALFAQDRGARAKPASPPRIPLLRPRSGTGGTYPRPPRSPACSRSPPRSRRAIPQPPRISIASSAIRPAIPSRSSSTPMRSHPGRRRMARPSIACFCCAVWCSLSKGSCKRASSRASSGSMSAAISSWASCTPSSMPRARCASTMARPPTNTRAPCSI